MQLGKLGGKINIMCFAKPEMIKPISFMMPIVLILSFETYSKMSVGEWAELKEKIAKVLGCTMEDLIEK